MEKAIIEAFYSDKSNYVGTLGMNCRIGLQCYKLLDEHCNLTQTGKELFDCRKEEDLCHLMEERAIRKRHWLIKRRDVTVFNQTSCGLQRPRGFD